MSEFGGMAEGVESERQNLIGAWEIVSEQWRDSVAAKIESEYLLSFLDLMQQSGQALAALDAAVEAAQTFNGDTA